MAVSDAQKVDLLYKKLFGVAKTDNSTNKSPSNESIASPLFLRGDTIWTQSTLIPNVAANVTSVVQGYTNAGAVQCTADTTSTAISSVYPSWKTNLTNWIPPEFGATYFVKVYAAAANVANVEATGTQLFAAGSGGTGEWYFDPVAGVLNFIGQTIPSALTVSNIIYVSGYRYIGTTGVASNVSGTFGNITISNNTIASTNTDGNINLTTSGNGIVVLSGTRGVQLPAGADAQRPASANAGTFRFSTTGSTIEWYTGSTWQAPTTSFTLITSNAQVADGTSVSFPLPVANATTAGTIVSINGIVQQPVAAYSITSNNIVFTEAPLASDVVDIRIFTTTASVSSVSDVFGNTGVFFDQVTSGEQIIYFKNAGTTSATFQPNGQMRMVSNIGSNSYTTGQLVVTGGVGISGNVYINDHMFAVAKSFLIDHPSKPDYKLQYTCLEGPENGVYVRGKVQNNNKIELPAYWTELVDESTITVDLTPIGKYQELYVEKIANNTVYLGNNGNFFYTVWAERKDIGKLIVEYPK